MNLNQDAGQDSFLDIVANLVGIMIILVVVVGVQANHEWSKPKTSNRQNEIDGLENEIAQQSLKHSKWKADRRRIESDIEAERREVKRLAQLRHQALVEMEWVESEIEKSKSSLDETRRKRLDQQVQLASLMAERDQLHANLAAYEAQPESIRNTITHYPTPIAKTVFSKEIHFRLSANRLVHVPIDELMTRMKSEWKFKSEKLKQVRSTIETVSAIGGFRMQYELFKDTETRRTEFGELSREVIKFRGFEILPTTSLNEETLEQAMSPGSRFHELVDGLEPGRATVSVWVYPDSFAEYSRLKVWLHEKGLQSAAWPLGEGELISGSPNGLRSTAQ